MSAKKKTARTVAIRHSMATLKGGPLNKVRVAQSCPGTLPMRLKGVTGFYDGNNTWQEI